MAENTKKISDTVKSKGSWISTTIDKAVAFANYFWEGVWSEPKNTMWIRILKIASLSVRTFFDRELQSKSMSLTYSTVLAIVPALALIFAIGRGFGFQNLLEEEIFKLFPSQGKALSTALGFVDSYLSEASQGLFVGVGIVVLLWTMISLLSNIEDAFNQLWDLRKGRTFVQKVTDYIAICLMVPILMVCSSGLTIFVTTEIDNGLSFLTPLVNIALEASPIFLAWLAFSLSYFLIPNTKVDFKYAAISGAICAILFDILQWLFVSGQMYVSKYNAIYGSFAFLPLLLIWLQLSWLILLFGCVLTYSMQNVFGFNFVGNIAAVSDNYIRRITLIIMTVIIKNFERHIDPMTPNQISIQYDLPFRIVSYICVKLHSAGFIYFTVKSGQEYGVAPAVDNDTFTVGDLFNGMDNVGESDFIPRFNINYGHLSTIADGGVVFDNPKYDNLLLRDLSVESPEGSDASL